MLFPLNLFSDGLLDTQELRDGDGYLSLNGFQTLVCFL
jgi:hypothetical protein